MKLLSKLLVLAVVLAALGAPANAALSITANLTNVNAAGDMGPCPQTFNFTGTIHTSGWLAGSDGKVQYRFERSDGSHGKTHQLTFPTSGGSKQVVDSWTHGGTGNAWELLHVLKPIDVLSHKSHFSTKCPGMSY
jgi:opacity protein-like surface antigen